MKFYENKETTPLRFFKFYRNILLPLFLLIGIFNSVSTVNKLISRAYDVPFIISSIENFVFLIIHLVILIGLIRWKRVAVPFLFIYLVLDVLSSIYGIVYSMMTTTHHLLTIVTILVVNLLSCFITFLIFIYFYKRKKLFDGIAYSIPKQKSQRKTIAQHFAVEDSDSPQSDVDITQEHCVCGYPIVDDRTTCPDCGREYEK